MNKLGKKTIEIVNNKNKIFLKLKYLINVAVGMYMLDHILTVV